MITSKSPQYGLAGLSTDTKPTENKKNGTVFFEMDTNTYYVFDEENQLWCEQP